MRRFNAIATAATLAVVFWGASVLAGAIDSVSATPDSLSIVQGGAGQFSVSIDKLSGKVPATTPTLPTVSYCQEWTIHVDGTATCDKTGLFTLARGRNYSQVPVGVGEYLGNVKVNVDSGAPCNTVVNLTETFTAQAGSGLDFGAGVLEVNRTVSVTITCAPSASVGGCSHGYWKNHLTEWPAPYTPNTTLGTVFQLGPFGSALGNVQLTDALEFEGGNSNQEKAQILLRNAVAALLNSAKTEIGYPWNTAEVVRDVNAALASTKDAMLSLEKQYEAANKLGSPSCGDPVE
jgi:hypothetical protein